MSASEPSIREVFYPAELEDMQSELARGNVPDETSAEREARAQVIFERNRRTVEADPVSEDTGSNAST